MTSAGTSSRLREVAFPATISPAVTPLVTNP